MAQVDHSPQRLGGASPSAHTPYALAQPRPQPHPSGSMSGGGKMGGASLAADPLAVRATCAGLANMAALTSLFPGPLSSMTAKDAQAAAALFSLPLPSAAACASFAASAAAAAVAASSVGLARDPDMTGGTKRARRLSSCGSELSSCTSSGTCMGVDEDEEGGSNGSESTYEEDDEGGVVFKRRRLTLEERQQRSRERNRMHAKKTRQRKKQQMDAMAHRIEELKSEYKQLRQVVEERYTAYILLNISSPPPPPLPYDIKAEQQPAGADLHASTDAADDPGPSGAGGGGGLPEGSISFGDILGGQDDQLSEEAAAAAAAKGEEGEEAGDEVDGCGALRTLSATSEDLLVLDANGKAKRTRRRGKYTPAERETIRRERNRMHAKKTRDRKKLFLDEAELTITRMEAENAQLRAFMHSNGMASQSDAVPSPPPLPVAPAAPAAPDAVGSSSSAVATPGEPSGCGDAATATAAPVGCAAGAGGGALASSLQEGTHEEDDDEQVATERTWH